jgi:hypothetical protein
MRCSPSSTVSSPAHTSDHRSGVDSEMAAVLKRQSIPIRRPTRSVTFEVELAQVADLTGELLVPLGYGTKELVSDEWSLPAHVGGAANWLGLGGLLVPSARHAGANLVVYVNNLQPSDLLRPMEADRG